MISDSQQKHIYDYFIDVNGNWFCEGNRVTDQQLLRVLWRSLFAQGDGYYIRCEGEVHPVRVADAPLWVRYVYLQKDAQGELFRIEIELYDGRREELDAETLSIVNEQALYCIATQRRLRARFGRAAYYELAQHAQTDDDGATFYFVINGQRYGVKSE
jgi:uncharacterized protein